MRFFASLDTTIFGVPYGSGVEVDTAGWTRQQLLSVLNLGVVYPGSVTIGMISDRLTFGGEGVTIETTADGQTLVNIATVAKPLAFATDVDDALAPAEGDALLYQDGQWVAAQLPAIPVAFADLQDVDISATPEEGQTLVWTVTGWKAVFSAGQNLVDLLDVIYDSSSPTDGDVLLWDGVNQTWKNAPATFVGEAGPAALTFVGNWSSSVQYSANPLPAPVVLYNGSSYVATGDSLNRAPDAYPTLWQLLAQKGATGATGTTGAKGDKGDKGDTGNTGATGKVVPAGGTYSIHGQVQLMAGTKRLYNDTGSTLAVTGVRVSAGTAPAGADLIVDINKNGTTMYATQGLRPKIVAGSNTGLSSQGWSWENGTYLTLDVDQVGSTTPGSDVTVTVICS